MRMLLDEFSSNYIRRYLLKYGKRTYCDENHFGGLCVVSRNLKQRQLVRMHKLHKSGANTQLGYMISDKSSVMAVSSKEDCIRIQFQYQRNIVLHISVMDSMLKKMIV